MASSKLDFPQFLPAPSCRSIVMIRLGSLFKSELRTLLLNSGDPQSSPAHFLNSDSQGSPKFTRASWPVWAVLINELFAARQALFKSDGRFLVSHCCDLALLFGGIVTDHVSSIQALIYYKIDYLINV